MRIVLFLTLALFSLSFAARAADCPLERIAVIPFATDKTGHIYLPVEIAGRAKRLMLDTGSFWSGVDKKFAASLGIESRRSSFGYQLRDAAGNIIDRYIRVPDFKLGPIVVDEPMDFMLVQGHDEDIVGVLGMNFFAYLDLEIDNAKKQISLFSQKHCRGAGVHWTDKSVTLTIIPDQKPYPLPFVWADLQGERIRALLDTGATYSHMDIDRAKRRYNIKDEDLKPVGHSVTMSGARIDDYLYTFKSLTVSGITFENVPFLLGKFPNSEMLLGMNELKTLHLYIAPKDEMVHVTDAYAQ